MKKLIALLMAIAVLLALCACAKSGEDGNGNTDDNSTATVDVFADIDKTSTEEQTVCDERAAKDVLSETFNTYLGGLTYLEGSDYGKLTYADLKEHIGVDCTAYIFDDMMSRGVYIWYADGNDACYLALSFNDKGNLVTAAALNLG